MNTPNRSLTPRGLTTYDEFDAGNGSRITVRQSSAALVLRAPERQGALVGQTGGPFVWVFIAPDHEGSPIAGAHLSLEQALRLREALGAFLREAAVEQTPAAPPPPHTHRHQHFSPNEYGAKHTTASGDYDHTHEHDHPHHDWHALGDVGGHPTGL